MAIGSEISSEEKFATASFTSGILKKTAIDDIINIGNTTFVAKRTGL